MFAVNDRVTWRVWGIQYTGTIIKIIGQEGVINTPGTLMVKPDGESRTVPVTPERAKKI